MNNWIVFIAAGLSTLSACNQRAPQPNENEVAASVGVQPHVADRQQAPTSVERRVPAKPAMPKTSLPEPKGSIDSKSVEAAGQVVQLYGALLESGRRTEAADLWSDPNAGLDFAKQFTKTVHLEIGELQPPEGAAGSIYTSMPITFYAGGFRRPAVVTLRRVNDVPGSSERQRRWHIDRIEWKSPV